MMNKSQHIGCSVSSCQYNNKGKDCSLNAISVQPCDNCSSGRPDESMCGSYKCR